MKRTPCEYMHWHGIPVIRKELVEHLMKHFGLNQRETAEKIGITPAAVCQYHKHKRGKNEIEDEAVKKEIYISAERIVKSNDDIVIHETCRICKILRTTTNFLQQCESLEEDKK